jgi:hypothetical protein
LIPRRTCVAQFFRYYSRPSWPLLEAYSKWTLALYLQIMEGEAPRDVRRPQHIFRGS